MNLQRFLLSLKNIYGWIIAKNIFNDVLVIIGVIMAGKGLYMIYPPLMWLVVGIFVIYLGLPRKKAVK